MLKLVNLTPHDVNLMRDGKVIETIPSTGLARCSMTASVIGDINGFPLSSNSYGEVVGLPCKEDNTIYIVSSIVAQAVKGLRDDVVIVDKTVRNSDNQIIGCEGFARI